jgi:hypothetical protein
MAGQNHGDKTTAGVESTISLLSVLLLMILSIYDSVLTEHWSHLAFDFRRTMRIRHAFSAFGSRPSFGFRPSAFGFESQSALFRISTSSSRVRLMGLAFMLLALADLSAISSIESAVIA